MRYFTEIVTFALLACILFVLGAGMLGYPYPESQIFSGAIGWVMREVAQTINNHQNNNHHPKGD